MSIERWVENAKGNHVALRNSGIISTAYPTRHGGWSAVWAGGARGHSQRLKGEHWSLEEVQEIIEQTERDGMDPGRRYPPDREWQHSNKGGYHRRLFGSIVSVKQAKSGSWYAARNGGLLGQRGQPTWFADEREAKAAWTNRSTVLAAGSGSDSSSGPQEMQEMFSYLV
jgi:hypothetical protein